MTRPFELLERLLPVSADFSTLTDVRPDATQITAAVKREGDVIDSDGEE